jgi:hypothetical protein
MSAADGPSRPFAGGAIRRRLRCLAALLFAFCAPAAAHDPFDGGTQMLVSDSAIVVNVTLGSDAARAFAVSLGLPAKETLRMTRPAPADGSIEIPPALAPRLVEVRSGGRPLAATGFAVVPTEIEVDFQIVYPSPGAGSVDVRAAYFDVVERMRAGSFVAALAGDHRVLASAILAPDHASVAVPLKAGAASGASSAGTSIAAYVVLGVRHILTGFDHLLFLGALLIGLRRVRPMLVVVSLFTLAHSLTLALATFGVVAPSPRIVEPLIAATIIGVCLENLFRREATVDRYWMCAAFGLVHGFGFAGALREAGLVGPGAGIALPLLGFNLGVEAGQLAVASIALPALLALRRNARVDRYVVPVGSGVVLVISTLWLLQRTGLIS